MFLIGTYIPNTFISSTNICEKKKILIEFEFTFALS